MTQSSYDPFSLKLKNIQMNDQIFNTGDIIVVSPGEKTTFRSITDSVLVVVKTPGAINDKFI